VRARRNSPDPPSEIRKIAIVVLGNPQWPVARLHVESIVAAVNSATPGSYVVEMPAGPGPE